MLKRSIAAAAFVAAPTISVAAQNPQAFSTSQSDPFILQPAHCVDTGFILFSDPSAVEDAPVERTKMSGSLKRRQKSECAGSEHDRRVVKILSRKFAGS